MSRQAVPPSSQIWALSLAKSRTMSPHTPRSSTGSVVQLADSASHDAESDASSQTTSERRQAVGTAPLANPLSSANLKQVSQYAMLTSITTGRFEDVKFHLFSRRARAAGRVDTPRPLYGNTALIRKMSSHFDFVFSHAFAEGELVDMDAPFPRSRAAYTTSYDYVEDSDLEDESDDEVEEKDDGPIAASRPSVRRARSTAAQEVPSSPRGGYTKNADGVGENPAGIPSPIPHTENTALGYPAILCLPWLTRKCAAKQNGQSKPHSTAGGADVTEYNPPTSGRKGRVVFIEDIAYRTWAAFLYYTYFNSVEFSTLKSEDVLVPSIALLEPYQPPPCSPKSMYRLAEKYGIQPLMNLAAENLRRQLTRHNILVELFSTFTSRYLHIQEVEIDYLGVHLLLDEQLLKRIPRYLQHLEERRLPRGSAAIFSVLLERTVAAEKLARRR